MATTHWLRAAAALSLSITLGVIQRAAAEPIRIGVLVSVTGPAAWLGEPELRGAQLAIEELNASGGLLGRRFELVVYDDQSTPEKAVTGAKKLLDQDKVDAIVGPSLVAASKAVAPLVGANGPVIYSLSGGYVPENPFMFGSSVHTEHMLETIVDWMKARGLTRVALLAATDSTGQVAVDAAKKVCPLKGIALAATERMNAGDVDVTAQLTRIRAAKPDAVVTWTTGTSAGVVVKNYAQLGLAAPLFLSHGNLSYSFISGIKSFQPKTLLMPSTMDIVWDSLPESEPAKARNAAFHEKYMARFSRQADFGPPVAYDAVMNLAEAFRRANSTDPRKVKDALQGTRGHRGLVATYDFAPDDHRGTGRKDTAIVKIEGGKFSLFGK